MYYVLIATLVFMAGGFVNVATNSYPWGIAVTAALGAIAMSIIAVGHGISTEIKNKKI